MEHGRIPPRMGFVFCFLGFFFYILVLEMVPMRATFFHHNGGDGLEFLETALSGQGGKLFRELRDNESLAYAIAIIRPPLDEKE